MLQQQRQFLKLNAVIMAAAIGGLSWLAAPAASATPYTPNFTPLITGLQARSAALSNNTSKVATKQKLAITKALALLQNTDSTSVATDLKNAVTVTTSLVKAFPADFTSPQPTGTTFEVLLVDAFIGFDGDISNLLHTAQNAIDLLPATTCRTKAQAVLSQAAAKLPAPNVTNLTTYSKALGSALKAVVSGQALALT